MNILVVGNVIKDVYLNLDARTEHFETDQTHTKWLDLAFNASTHHFWGQNTTLGGAAISLEVFHNFGLNASTATNSTTPDTTPDDATSRYILVAGNQVTYFTPSDFAKTTFTTPNDNIDYLYLDRSAEITPETASKITTYLDSHPHTKLVIYLRDPKNRTLKPLLSRADLLFSELPDALASAKTPKNPKNPQNLAKLPKNLQHLDPAKIIQISPTRLSYLDVTEDISIARADILTHLSAYSIISATILSCFILGYSVENSLKFAHLNLAHSRLNSTLTLKNLQKLAKNSPKTTSNDLELTAAALLAPKKGILAADESGGSIHKKFDQLDIPDTYDNRRDYRNLFFTTKDLEKYVSGVILFDETARQIADNGQNFVDFLTSRRIIPGIKVDQGLEKFSETSTEEADPDETYTKGLDGLKARLQEYYQMGLRFAKWRAAFNFDQAKNTPTDAAITKNCQILAEYAKTCQDQHIVPIVEPELVYDGDYDIDQSAATTAKILDQLFLELKNHHVNLRACILKCNMVLTGKQQKHQSTPEEVGKRTAETLKNHVPKDLAGVVFLSGGQTPEQATDNLAVVAENGPFPWPVTFSFARALQDPALYAWAGDNQNANKAREAFLDRLKKNSDAVTRSI